MEQKAWGFECGLYPDQLDQICQAAGTLRALGFRGLGMEVLAVQGLGFRGRGFRGQGFRGFRNFRL